MWWLLKKNGRATVAHCDVLIAVWDGKPPRGRGGTGEVVQLALTRGTAIVHVPLDKRADTRILCGPGARFGRVKPALPDW